MKRHVNSFWIPWNLLSSQNCCFAAMILPRSTKKTLLYNFMIFRNILKLIWCFCIDSKMKDAIKNWAVWEWGIFSSLNGCQSNWRGKGRWIKCPCRPRGRQHTGENREQRTPQKVVQVEWRSSVSSWKSLMKFHLAFSGCNPDLLISRECLCRVLKEKMELFKSEKREILEQEEYLKTFLDNEVKPLWPKGWMQSRYKTMTHFFTSLLFIYIRFLCFRVLMSESRKILNLVTPSLWVLEKPSFTSRYYELLSFGQNKVNVEESSLLHMKMMGNVV